MHCAGCGYLYLPTRRKKECTPPPTTPTTSHGLYHNSDRSVGSADQYSLLNPRFEPAMATRGGRRPRFEPSMATRGRRPPQHANYVRTTRTVRRPSSNYDTSRYTTGLAPRPHSRRSPGGLAHQSRRRALGFGKSPRNLMPGSETVWANGLVATRTIWDLMRRPACSCDTRRPPTHHQNPMRGARQGHRQFFERTSTLHRVGYNRLTSL